jgi:hypothetical protein
MCSLASCMLSWSSSYSMECRRLISGWVESSDAVFGRMGSTIVAYIQIRDPICRGRSVEYCVIEHNQPANSFTFFFILANLITTMGGAKVRAFPLSR